MQKPTPEALAELAQLTSNTLARMGFRPKRIRVPYLLPNTSKYDPHVGRKEKAKALKRVEVVNA
jgi:hypothetical protein